MGEELEKIFDALGHRVRRRVVEELGKRGSATYSELMKAAGVEDSGTFAFHLRKLLDLGLVRKNERGEYVLTDLGMRAYSTIKVLQGELTAYPQPSAMPQDRAETGKPMVVSDVVRFVLTKNLAEELERSGRRIKVQRVTKLFVEPMPRELLSHVLDSIEDCTVVEAPRELMEIIVPRSRNVAVFRDLREGRVTFVSKGIGAAIAESIGRLASRLATLGPRIALSTVSAIMESLPKFIEVVGRRSEVIEERRIELPTNIKCIKLFADSSSITIEPSDKPELIVRKRGKDVGEVGIDTLDGTLELTADTVEIKLLVPRDLEEVRATCDSSAMKIEGVTISRIVMRADSSALSLSNVKILGVLFAELDSSVLNVSARIEPHTMSSVDISASAAAVKIRISVPPDAKVSISSLAHRCSAINAKVDGKSVGLDYREPGYDESQKKVSIKLDAEGTALALRIKHE